MENNINNIPNLDAKMNMLNDTRQQLKKLQEQEKTLKQTQTISYALRSFEIVLRGNLVDIKVLNSYSISQTVKATDRPGRQ